MGRVQKELARVSVWRGPPGVALSHVPYRDRTDTLLSNVDVVVLLNNFLFEQKEPPKPVRVTVEWDEMQKGP